VGRRKERHGDSEENKGKRNLEIGRRKRERDTGGQRGGNNERQGDCEEEEGTRDMEIERRKKERETWRLRGGRRNERHGD
jgi:hypothetical protein